MTDLFILLGIDENTAPEQIQAAYNAKKAALLGQEGYDPAVLEEINHLDSAYTQFTNQTKLALKPTEPFKRPVDPILGVVDSIDSSIRENSEDAFYLPCPYCGIQNPSQAVVCSACGKQISRPCPNCGKRVLLSQTVCPRCNSMMREQDQQRLADAVITKQRVQGERLDDHMRVEQQERAHSERAKFGILLWAAIILAVIAICAIGVYAINYFSTH